MFGYHVSFIPSHCALQVMLHNSKESCRTVSSISHVLTFDKVFILIECPIKYAKDRWPITVINFVIFHCIVVQLLWCLTANGSSCKFMIDQSCQTSECSAGLQLVAISTKKRKSWLDKFQKKWIWFVLARILDNAVQPWNQESSKPGPLRNNLRRWHTAYMAFLCLPNGNFSVDCPGRYNNCLINNVELYHEYKSLIILIEPNGGISNGIEASGYPV